MNDEKTKRAYRITYRPEHKEKIRFICFTGAEILKALEEIAVRIQAMHTISGEGEARITIVVEAVQCIRAENISETTDGLAMMFDIKREREEMIKETEALEKGQQTIVEPGDSDNPET